MTPGRAVWVAVALAAFALASAGCVHAPPGSSGPRPTDAAEPVVRFVALGDGGTGGPGQAEVAAAMAQACRLRGCDFAVVLGDNIYDAGPASDHDPQFDAKFEVPYGNLSFPFWMVLGNHDNSDDPAHTGATAGLGTWYSSGDHEVEYGKRTDRASPKWTMPARYYRFDAPAPGTTVPVVSFVALDTNTLVFDDVAIPPDVTKDIQQAAGAQTRWVDDTMAALPGPWRIALGHHPYLSNGPHGNAGSYDGRPAAPGVSGESFRQFMEAHVCGRVDLYLSGHDHDLEWFEPASSCPGTQLVVSGGGGADTYALTGTNAARFQARTLGFWYLEATSTSLHLTAFDSRGTALADGTVTKAP